MALFVVVVAAGLVVEVAVLNAGVGLGDDGVPLGVGFVRVVSWPFRGGRHERGFVEVVQHAGVLSGALGLS